MRIVIIECTAEELRANKTLAESIADALYTAFDRVVGNAVKDEEEFDEEE